MAKRLTSLQQLSSKVETLSDAEATQVLEYINAMEAKRKLISTTNTTEDDLIDYLANTSENLCARQVIEWEKVRRRSDVQAELNMHSFAATNK
ncbi:MAG: hypothetical protein HY819_24915 [Acidobacteria bacterium]|nr:hypothetical protein [Acidobacteriota bacterium]